MRKTLLTAIVCCFSPLLYAAPELSGTPHELSQYLLDARKIIAISGNGEVKVEADQAIVSLTIKNEAKSLNGALTANDALQQKVKQQLLDSGISSDKIKAANFSSTPDYGWLKEKPKSYEISREIKVTIDTALQMRTIGQVVDAIDEVFMTAMSFEDSAKKGHELKAQQQALDSILNKKSMYEKTFNVSLILIKVIEQGVHPLYQTPIRRQPHKAEALVNSFMEVDTAAPSDQFAGVTYRASSMAEFAVAQ